MFEVFVIRGRTSYDVITLYEADDNGLTLNSGDVVRFKAWRRNAATPDLDIDSAAALSGGSVVQVNQTASAAVVTLLVAQGDTEGLGVGAYDAEVSVVDSGDSNRIKVAEQGILHVLDSGGGDLGLT